MVKYHISSDGMPNICSADKKPCTLGADKPHFDTQEAAREYYEKDNASKTITKTLTKNNPSDNDLESLKLDKELESMSKDEANAVRRSVASNPNTPTHVLEALSKDENLKVRSSIAENPNTPIHVLETLSKDKDSIVRYSVAFNRKTPPSVLEVLSKDEYWIVQETATIRLEEL